MQILKYSIIIITILLSHTVYGQNIQGTATYKTQRQMDINIDSSSMGSAMHEQMMEMLKKQFEKTFTLGFNSSESLYKEKEKLEEVQNDNVMIAVVDTGGGGVIYRNVKEQAKISQNEVFGKVFLISDSMEKQDWKLENQTKNIGRYTCHKATRTREAEVMRTGISVNGDNDEGIDNDEVETETVTVTAWYTTQIPVSTGPANYYGLPGLILEISDGSESILCSKIELSKNDILNIEAPTKGKKVSQEKFGKIVEKKMRQMENQYRHNREGDGQTIEIRVGN